MPGKILIAVLEAVLFAAAVAPVRAGDEMRAVSALWDDFVAALRRGDYLAAHGLFTPESRAALPYADFVREYGPLSAARELVLASPESRGVRVDGEWAEIASSGTAPGSGKRLAIGAAAVRNQGAWGLVAARNEANERLEAQARSVLRLMASWRGRTDAAKRLEEFAASETAKGNPVFSRYRFARDGARLLALPLLPGCRRFQVDPWGEVRPDAPAPPLPAAGYAGDSRPAGRRPPAPPEPSAEPAASVPGGLGGLPELGEPPATTLEMPEPPEPPRPAAASPDFEPGPVSLPDAIQ